MIQKVHNAYYMYMMIVRALNTAIMDYNYEFPSYMIPELDIPEPRYIDYNVELSSYLREMLLNVNEILD